MERGPTPSSGAAIIVSVARGRKKFLAFLFPAWMLERAEAITMPSDSPSTLAGRPEQFSTRVAFFIAGFAMAVWAPLVPFAKTRAGLDDGMLGLLLLCLGVGSIVAMPLAGILAGRFGCRRVIGAATVLICLTLPLLATVSSVPWLVAALFVFGAGIGSVDCTVNIQAVIVERASGRAMMSGFHGLFSLGGIAGAGGMSALFSAGLSPLSATFCVLPVILLAILWAAPHFLSSGGAGSGPAFAVPRGIVLFIGLLCFVVFLTEGAMLDWGAVFLIGERAVDPAHAGLGYAAFATTMTMGRLTGDAIVRRLGGANVLLFGSLCASLGLALAVLSSGWLAGLLGFALVGAGCSNIVPVLYTAIGRQKTMPESIAVPAITTIGYAGILAGPAFIGFVAQGTSLSFAFLGVAVLLLGVAASSRFVRT